MAARINSFREIAGRYDVVLCDVWGVLHNGVQAFASACEALAEARAAGLTVVLITNSPRPHPGVKIQIRGLGVPDESYDRIVTSGDVTRALIAAIPDPFGRQPDARQGRARGEVPSALDPPPGCHFHPRCTRKQDTCTTLEPLLESVGPAHRAACHFAERRMPAA